MIQYNVLYSTIRRRIKRKKKNFNKKRIKDRRRQKYNKEEFKKKEEERIKKYLIGYFIMEEYVVTIFIEVISIFIKIKQHRRR